MTNHNMPCQVYLDATYLAHCADLRGIGQVISQLCRLMLSDQRFAAVQFLTTRGTSQRTLSILGIPLSRQVVVPNIPVLGRIERFHGMLAGFRYTPIRGNASLIIHPEFRTIIGDGRNQVVLFYDFMDQAPQAIGHNRRLSRYLYYRYKLTRAVKSEHIITISEHTRSCLLSAYRSIKPHSVVTLHLGARLQPHSTVHKSLMSDAPVEYLYVGSFEPRKNVTQMLANLDVIFNGTNDFRLHLVGNIRPQFVKSLDRALVTSGHQNRIIVHGLVPDTILAGLYSQAHFLLFPSLAEGFGLPLAEAMRFGVVPCAFRNTSIPEVVGNAGIMADNNDFISWGSSIAELVANPDAFTRRSTTCIDCSSRFTEENMFKRYGDYFTSLIRQASHDLLGKKRPEPRES